MLYARVNGVLEEARHSLVGLCPSCGDQLIPKCGRIVYPYWSHQKRSDCDSWSEPESDWHRVWKSLFPAERCEVVMGPHRADAIDGRGRVVELQSSSLSFAEVEERSRFYGRMLWVVNARHHFHNFRLGPCGRAVRDKKGHWHTPFRDCYGCWRDFHTMHEYTNGIEYDDPGVCPYCNVKLVRRVNNKTWQRFFGCPSFPRCRFTRPYKTFSIVPVNRVWRYRDIPYRWSSPIKWVRHAIAAGMSVFLDFGNWIVGLLNHNRCEVISTVEFLQYDLLLEPSTYATWGGPIDDDCHPGVCGWNLKQHTDQLLAEQEDSARRIRRLAEISQPVFVRRLAEIRGWSEER